MSEKNDTSIESSAKNEKISIGGAIRKQRVSMNISIEKVSKDLRISKSYIEAIEIDKFDVIPAAAYVRVYVKTIAEYLSLDSEKLLKLLPSERSKTSGLSEKDYPLNEKEMSVSKSISERKKGGKSGLPVLLVILLLVLAYAIMSKNNGWHVFERSAAVNDTETFDIIKDEEIDSLDYNIPDSLIRGDTLIVEDTAAAPKAIELTLQIVRDSSYIMIVSDGKITNEGWIRSSARVITASANDSINVNTSALHATEITINGEKIDRTGATGIWTFTKDATRNLTLADWRRVRRAPL